MFCPVKTRRSGGSVFEEQNRASRAQDTPQFSQYLRVILDRTQREGAHRAIEGIVAKGDRFAHTLAQIRCHAALLRLFARQIEQAAIGVDTAKARNRLLVVIAHVYPAATAQLENISACAGDDEFAALQYRRGRPCPDDQTWQNMLVIPLCDAQASLLLTRVNTKNCSAFERTGNGQGASLGNYVENAGIACYASAMVRASTSFAHTGLSGPRRVLLWASAALLLLLPLIAMQFTIEVNWGPEDFVTFGAMLLLLCLAIEISFRLARTRRNAILAATLAGLVFLLVWAELAVGILD